MKYHLSLLALAFLAACAAPRNSRGSPPPAGEPAFRSSGPSTAAPEKAAEPAIEKSFRSPVAACLDAAIRACRAREYGLLNQSRAEGGEWVVSAEGRGFAVRLTIAPAADHRTRIAAVVRGRAAEENRDEALGLLDRVRAELLEPLD